MHRSTRPNNRDHGRLAAGLFAATVVLTSGVGLCLGIAFIFAPDISRPLAVILSGAAGLSLLLWMLAETPSHRTHDSNLYTAEQETLTDYVETFHPELRRREGRQFGTNEPPTAEGLRKIRDDSNAWFPSERRAREYRKAIGEED